MLGTAIGTVRRNTRKVAAAISSGPALTGCFLPGVDDAFQWRVCLSQRFDGSIQLFILLGAGCVFHIAPETAFWNHKVVRFGGDGCKLFCIRLFAVGGNVFAHLVVDFPCPVVGQALEEQQREDVGFVVLNFVVKDFGHTPQGIAKLLFGYHEFSMSLGEVSAGLSVAKLLCKQTIAFRFVPHAARNNGRMYAQFFCQCHHILGQVAGARA